MRTIFREIVSGVILSSDNQILLGQKNPSGGMYIGQWVVPGGGINEGETPLAAIQRELLEETHLRINTEHIELFDDTLSGAAEKILRTTQERVWCEMHFHIFKIVLPSLAAAYAARPGDDLIECRWFPVTELSALPLPPPSLVLFKKLGYL